MSQDLRVATETTPCAPAIEMDALRSRCSGIVSFALALLSEMETQGTDHVARIRRQLAAGDGRAAAEAAHALKGAAAIIAAEPLRCLAAQIESASRCGDLERSALLTDMLSQEMDRCLQMVTRIRHECAP